MQSAQKQKRRQAAVGNNGGNFCRLLQQPVIFITVGNKVSAECRDSPVLSQEICKLHTGNNRDFVLVLTHLGNKKQLWLTEMGVYVCVCFCLFVYF